VNTRPCTWPDGGCGAEVIFVQSATSDKKMILDTKPEKRVVLMVKRSTTDPAASLLVLSSDQPGNPSDFARVADVYTDHHATCTAFELYQQRQRAAKAGRG
jgi:hypothetical protein